MRCGAWIVVLALVGWGAGWTSAGEDLSDAVRLEANGQPIDVTVGHAAPLVLDWDGDGVRDLLVGQMGGGRLRIYRNVGTDAAPRFEGFEHFRAAGADATVPSG